MILSGWESIFFWVFAVATLVAGLLTIMARNAVHSALFLISTLVSVAALFILLGAEFIAGVQILVYVGGVMVLFLFVIMLVNVSAEERGREELFNRPAQVGASVLFLLPLALGFIYAFNQSAPQFRPPGSTPDQSAEELVAHQSARRADQERRLPMAATRTSRLSDDTQRVGASLYRYGGLPFEIASVLLLVAIVGSVMLARTAKQEMAADDSEMAASPETTRAEGSSAI
ncbi:MAG TPA: NADH-quinone oxidoreductase subunit J [Pyrinomonadaceae bacterium]|nr:NADH-quinone oxidoreductase subunit J [Pyrinomonadaceae bacterium]